MRVEDGTAGLVTAYQLASVATEGISTTLETADFMRIGVVTLPLHLPLPLTKPPVDIQPGVIARREDKLAEGYRSMAVENSMLAEEYLPVALEAWPTWEK